jgi:site-specific DNA recombinase
VYTLVTVTSEMTFGNDIKMLVARITAPVATNESARKSERIQLKILQNVEAGLANGRAQRPFEYEADKMTGRQPEANIPSRARFAISRR